MAQLAISEVARRVGLRPSAIRYYEHIGLLAPLRRESGQRRYDLSAVHRLAVVRRAQEAGFSLMEIRSLFLGFQPSVPVPARWKKLASRKLLELDATIEKIRMMKGLLGRIQSKCGCDTVEQCGATILQRGFPKGPEPSRQMTREQGRPRSGF
jgi:MerR family redox-sensitive transcriptional activator SoxR